jgi:DNA-binding HxlR family transcriptional regulator
MSSAFGQFCPVALASETLTQKWMLLVLRELCAGAERFNEIRRGVPRMSATLLKERLDALERAGVIERRRAGKSGALAYALTEAGEDLRPVLASIGAWGQRWARDIRAEDLDPRWLVWAMHRRLDTSAMPPGRTVIAFVFADAPANKRRVWLVCSDGDVDVCIKPPAFETDVTVRVGVRAMAEIWRGLRAIDEEIRAGRMQLEGKTQLCRAFPRWLMLSAFAQIERARG